RETSLEDEFADDDAPLADDSSPDISLARHEAAERVRAALMRLPESYRSVLVLRHYEDLKFREIAEVLGVPEGTVKSRMAEGLAQLARLLEAERGHSTMASMRRSEQRKE